MSCNRCQAGRFVSGQPCSRPEKAQHSLQVCQHMSRCSQRGARRSSQAHLVSWWLVNVAYRLLGARCATGPLLATHSGGPAHPASTTAHPASTTAHLCRAARGGAQRSAKPRGANNRHTRAEPMFSFISQPAISLTGITRPLAAVSNPRTQRSSRSLAP